MKHCLECLIYYFPTHENKRDNNKFNGRKKGVKCSSCHTVGIMQNNTGQVAGNEWRKSSPFFQEALVPRLQRGPNPQAPWEQPQQHNPLPPFQESLVPRLLGSYLLAPLGTITRTTPGDPFTRIADHVSLWSKRATCTEHFIPSYGFL